MKLVKLFERTSNDFEYQIYKLQIKPFFLNDKLSDFSSRKVKKMYDIHNEKHFIRYRFELLKHWMRLNEFYDKNYVTRLESLIHKLRLTHELNAYEQEYLNHYQGVVFAKIRNLKNLIVDFSTARNEEVYYKYENVGFYRLVNKRLIPTKLNGELFITTHKILLSSGLEIFTINFDEIMNFKISPQGLLIFTAHNIYSFKSYDDYLLYVSLERILKLKKWNTKWLIND